MFVRPCACLKPVLRGTRSLVFFLNLAQWDLVRIKKKTGKNRITRKILFYPKMKKMGPKRSENGVFLHISKDFVISFFLKQSKMKNHIVIYISPQTPFLSKFWFSSYVPKCPWPDRFNDSLKCNISRKKRTIKLIFCMWVNVKDSFKLILLFLMDEGMHA